MEILSADLDIESFFSQVAKANSCLLLLDYDGTLARFHIKRDQAFPYPRVLELLSEIIGSQLSRVVIISRRAIEDLIPLLRMKPLPEV